MSEYAEYSVPPLPSVTAASSAAAVPVADVLLFHTADGGEIAIANGQPTMTAGLETAAYLSLFGGNELDGGLQADDRKQWWGNLGETDPARTYRSRTQNLLRALPATSNNLRRVEDAAGADLAWFVEAEVASKVEATATMPGLNRVALTVRLTVENVVYEMVFAAQWGSATG